MASPPAQPSSPSPPPPAPTTIIALDYDLLPEIFLCLPDVTTLARAAFSCRAFLRAVRSSPTFRRHFREIHAPPLLALLSMPYMEAVVPAAAGRRSSDTDIAAAFAHLLQDDCASEWGTGSRIPYDGYVHFVNRTTDQGSLYSPHSQAVTIYPKKRPCGSYAAYNYLEFHTLYPDGEEQQPSRVVCVHHEYSWRWARVAVFSSHTMEWNILPKTWSLLLMGDEFITGTVVDGFVCWLHRGEGCIVALNTATFHFDRMDLPRSLRNPFARFMLGQTKDGKICIVSKRKCELSVWIWTIHDNGVESFVLHKVLPLHTSVKEVTKCSEVDNVELQLMTVISGFVYLSVVYCREPQSPQWFLSICLETAEVNDHFVHDVL